MDRNSWWNFGFSWLEVHIETCLCVLAVGHWTSLKRLTFDIPWMQMKLFRFRQVPGTLSSFQNHSVWATISQVCNLSSEKKTIKQLATEGASRKNAGSLLGLCLLFFIWAANWVIWLGSRWKRRPLIPKFAKMGSVMYTNGKPQCLKPLQQFKNLNPKMASPHTFQPVNLSQVSWWPFANNMACKLHLPQNETWCRQPFNST